jgi:hypothetical protein
MSPALIVHIAAGMVGLVSGAGALCMRKGERLHRLLGTAFFVSMLTMAAMATFLGLTIPDRGNVPGGVFTFYLVATGWGAVRRREPGAGPFDYAALMVALAAAGLAIVFAVQAHGSPTGLLDRKPAPLYGIFASLAVFAVVLDVKMIIGRGLQGRQRIARHIWRMCAALFFASGSFFLGQQQVLPVFIQGSPVLFALALAPLVVMIAWLIRIRFRNPYRAALA